MSHAPPDYLRRRFCLMALSGCAILATPLLHAATTRMLTYYGKHHLELPQRIERVATSWEAHNAILAMLGFGDRIVATTRIARDIPAFRRLVPGIAKASLSATDGMLNIEELVRLKPDVLFVAGPLPPAQLKQLNGAGIAVAQLRYNSLTALLERVRITGEILGPAAERKAREYHDYFQHNVQRVKKAMAGVPASSRLRLYHAVGNPLSTSGRPSLNQDWMDLAGVRNIAEHWFTGTHSATAQVSLEQIYTQPPDVIVAMRASDAAAIRSDPRWRNLPAVRRQQVLANPRGMFWWCRETSEQALQFLWLARTLYPDALPDIDLKKETRDFYHRFYALRLESAEIAQFLHPPV